LPWGLLGQPLLRELEQDVKRIARKETATAAHANFFMLMRIFSIQRKYRTNIFNVLLSA
jgi:hypothetical protein